MSNPFVAEGTESLDDLSCHIAPCCHATVLAPGDMDAEAAEAIKDHMAECMVGAISANQTPEHLERSIAAVREMFE